MADEVRITDPNTGGQKGQKDAQLGAIDPLALLELAKVAGFGARKYDTFNYVRGYDWQLSFDAMSRHMLAFQNGEDLDEESGLPHMAHAAWHGLALTTFLLRGRGTDTRISAFLDGLSEPTPTGRSLEGREEIEVGDVVHGSWGPAPATVLGFNSDGSHVHVRFDDGHRAAFFLSEVRRA